MSNAVAVVWAGLHFTAGAINTQRVEGIQYHMKHGLSSKSSLEQAFFEANAWILNQSSLDGQGTPWDGASFAFWGEIIQGQAITVTLP
jgi:hypothetical protein